MFLIIREPQAKLFGQVLAAEISVKSEHETVHFAMSICFIIFQLFCYNDEQYMQKGEFKFMMNKLCNAIGATIQIKKSFLQELMKNVDSKLLGKNREFIY